jgi:rRNA maturation protein Nop10
MNIQVINTVLISRAKLVHNNGQIEGVPKNPRFIKDDKFKKLVKSIQDDPEMIGARELIVTPHGDKYVVLCGNMRLRALKECGVDKIPCKVVEGNAAKLRAYIIKDNVSFGSDDFELLANEWDLFELEEWGMDLQNEDVQEQEYNTKTTLDKCPTCGQKIDNTVPF